MQMQPQVRGVDGGSRWSIEQCNAWRVANATWNMRDESGSAAAMWHVARSIILQLHRVAEQTLSQRDPEALGTDA
jgi:hypothetical protein